MSHPPTVEIWRRLRPPPIEEPCYGLLWRLIEARHALLTHCTHTHTHTHTSSLHTLTFLSSLFHFFPSAVLLKSPPFLSFFLISNRPPNPPFTSRPSVLSKVSLLPSSPSLHSHSFPFKLRKNVETRE